MLEIIRRLVMERIRDRKIAMERRPGVVCPRIMRLLDERFLLSENMVSTWNGGDLFEVESLGNTYVVDLKARECTCRIWQLTGIPCAHAIPCITTVRMEPVDMVDPCYNKSLFIQTYSNVLSPTTSPAFWESTNTTALAPPLCVRQSGRPKKLRKRGPLEGVNEKEKEKEKMKSSKKGARRCSICSATDHTKAKCPQRPSAPEPAKGKGKKRKAADDDAAGPSTRRRSTRNKKQQELSQLEELMRKTQEEPPVRVTVRDVDE